MIDSLLGGELGKFKKLYDIGSRIAMTDIKGIHLVDIFEVFDINLDPNKASLIAEGIPQFMLDSDKTLADFVKNGGIMRLLAGVKTGDDDAVIRCPECSTLIFL